jgi:long-chain acyl-CoA synthetase
MVREAVVYGSDAGGAGQEVRAAVVLGGQVSRAELLAFCRSRLAAYKVPAQVDIVADLPKTSLGKIRRAELKPDAERDALQAAPLS